MNILVPVVGLFISFLLVRLTAERLISFLRARGLVRPDAHKPGSPEVAHSGGVILFLGVSAAVALTALAAESTASARVLVAFSSAAVCFAVGLVDDIKILRGSVKTLLSILGILPILVVGVTSPGLIEWGRPELPLIGRLRLTIIYWALMPISVAGAANVVNMLDVMNGVVPGTSIVIFSALALIGAILNREATLTLSLITLGALLAYYRYNAYPARVFNGDSGSLFLGALIGALAVVDHLEFVALTLLLPHILNGFFILVSFRGFREHREVRKRPILVDSDGTLRANSDPEAPLSLTRLILAVGGPSSEREVAKAYVAIEIFAAALAVLSALLTPTR